MRLRINKALKNNLDYVEIYAVLFAQQKKLIESQLRASKELFKKRFGTGEIIKINAGKYLKSIGKI